MSREEFMELNPCVAKAITGKKVNREDLIKQGKFLSNHTFIFAQLSPREAEILKLRLGLQDDVFYTQQQISKTFGVSIARIQQIEKNTLLKLAKTENMELLMKYDDESAKSLFIKQKIKFFDYRKALLEDIEKIIIEGEVLIWSNIPITEMFIPSAFRSSIKQRLVAGGIKNIENLVSYWKNNQNLRKFQLVDATYLAVMVGIARMFEDGSIEINPKELLDQYNARKKEYLNYLRDNKLSDKVIFPELTEGQKIQEEHKEDKEITRQKELAILQVRKAFGAKSWPVPIEAIKSSISLRAYNALRRADIHTIEDLIDYYYNYNKSFISIRWLSVVGEEEVLSALENLGITLREENLNCNII